MGVSHLPILIILVVIALIVFGPKRLPELGNGLGKAIAEFKKGAAELTASHVTASSTASVQPVAMITPAPVEASAAPAAAPQVGQPPTTA